MQLVKRTLAGALLTLLLAALPLRSYALDADTLVPVGAAVGIELETEGVTVTGFTEVETAAGPLRPAETAGLRKGDVITAIGDRSISNAAEFLSAMNGRDSGPLRLKVLRDGRELELAVTPALNREGLAQIGLWLRDGISGIGTVTYYDPASGAFGALGHGINDVETGQLLDVDQGNITEAEIVDVIPGAAGNPGELCGQFQRDVVLGVLEKNTDCGLFGTAALDSLGPPLPVAAEDEITLGSATIRSNVRGGLIRDYSVEISRIYRDPGDNRFLMLTVTDPELLGVTGGIVQGMSGSPIIQNGKLVGAVTHVLLNDPKRGYGISIERMLNAAA